MDLPATLVLIAITVAASLVALRNPPMLEALLLWAPAVRKRGEWWRLFTYGLVHADLTHLLVNMLTFYFFGRVLEDFYAAHLGPSGFYLFYAAALLASILPSYMTHRDDADYRSLGASGAVSAVLFAYILFEPWSMLYVFFALPVPAIVYAVLYVAYSLHAGARGGDHINHSAHLWGGAFGVAFTLVLDPSLVNRFLAALLHPGFG
jgi:membrane associated rhomboid family serine protease